jgi:hypothetical protein
MTYTPTGLRNCRRSAKDGIGPSALTVFFKKLLIDPTRAEPHARRSAFACAINGFLIQARKLLRANYEEQIVIFLS